MSRKDDIIKDLQDLAANEKANHFKPGTVTGDRVLISLERDVEVRAWAASLGCSEQELREAVKVVGYSADEVRRYLSYRKR